MAAVSLEIEAFEVDELSQVFDLSESLVVKEQLLVECRGAVVLVTVVADQVAQVLVGQDGRAVLLGLYLLSVALGAAIIARVPRGIWRHVQAVAISAAAANRAVEVGVRVIVLSVLGRATGADVVGRGLVKAGVVRGAGNRAVAALRLRVALITLVRANLKVDGAGGNSRFFGRGVIFLLRRGGRFDNAKVVAGEYGAHKFKFEL